MNIIDEESLYNVVGGGWMDGFCFGAGAASIGWGTAALIAAKYGAAAVSTGGTGAAVLLVIDAVCLGYAAYNYFG